MQSRNLNSVGTILIPVSRELALEPSVHLNDPLTTAIEIMIKHNRSAIAVCWNHRPVGQIRLKDALALIGIRIP